ncbi:MAG: hypothetical protein HYZ27_07320 [Deltaproteobacteria bacterium]|nr:hypothetical protein [Deltaproteobacteria bacterium]
MGETPAPGSDSVEEVLQAASEQALRLSHLEDLLKGVEQTVADLRDEMHAGFVELRVVGEKRAAKPGEGTREILSDRLDGVEAQATRAGARTALLLGVAVIQAVLTAIVLFLVMQQGESAEPESVLPALSGAPAEIEKPAPVVEDPKAAPKKPKRRR